MSIDKLHLSRIYVEISCASDDVNVLRAEQILKLAAISIFISLHILNRGTKTGSGVVFQTTICILILKIADEIRTWRKGMTEAKTY